MSQLPHPIRGILQGAIVGLTLLSSCQGLNARTPTPQQPAPVVAQTTNPVTLRWFNDFSGDWRSDWGIRSGGQFGGQNIEVIPDSTGRFPQVLRVHYPAGSVSPSYSRATGAPIGGAQFIGDLGQPARTFLRLSYFVRFSDDFEFVKGGKLPGLFGGTEISGGNIPDGTNGFSTRYMWRTNGNGEVYAYLPTSEINGTSIGRGRWQFQPGVWYRLEQEVTLNRPGRSNGRIRVWVNGQQVLDQQGLTFRSTEDLKLEGIFFSTFFGGNDSSWATPKDVYVDFANFAVSARD